MQTFTNHPYYTFHNSIDIYLSILTSLILFLGNYHAGRYLVSKTMLGMFDNNQYRFFHYPLIGNMCMNALIQFGLATTIPVHKVVYAVGAPFFLLGIFSIGHLIVYKRIKLTNLLIPISKNTSKSIFLCLIGGFFLLALAPITNADALDYHLGVPIWILKHQQVVWQPTWFHQGMAGIGENSILISLVFNAEQIATLSQYMGLLSIIGLLYSFNPIHKNQIDMQRSWWGILILSTPVLLFLGSSPKPQLTGIACTSLIFLLFIQGKLKLNELDLKKMFVILFILMYAVLIKLNFAFSVSILSCFILFDGIRKKEIDAPTLTKFLIACMIAAGILLAPYIAIKNVMWGTDFAHYFHPIPSSNPGFEKFMLYLSNYRDNNLPFPFTIFIPKSLGQASMILGINALIVLSLLFFHKNNKYQLGIIGILCLLIFLFSQRSARFFFEPMIWIILYLFTNSFFIKRWNRGYRLMVYFTGLMQLLLLGFGIITLTKGILSLHDRNEVMAKTANGYALSEWVNNKIPAASNILISHRSTALFKQNVYKAEWLNYIEKNKHEKEFFESYLKKEKIDYVILTGDDPEKSPLYPYCENKIAGPFQFNRETRNPANTSQTTNAWIYSSNLH